MPHPFSALCALYINYDKVRHAHRPNAPFAIAFSVGFFFGAVTVVSTYDRVCPSHEHELSETEQPDDLRGLTILLVEDSPVVADALKQHLELLGATVAAPAATTAEAKEIIMAGRPDVALVDFHLRGENSCTLIAQLRQEGIPVIMLSGSIESPAQALLHGVMMLEKPVREERIPEHLRPIARTRQK